MIDFQERADLKQTTYRPSTTMLVRTEGMREYLDLAAAIASVVIVLFMAGSTVFALALALGGSALAYGMAGLFVLMALVFISAFWIDFLPWPPRRQQ